MKIQCPAGNPVTQFTQLTPGVTEAVQCLFFSQISKEGRKRVLLGGSSLGGGKGCRKKETGGGESIV